MRPEELDAALLAAHHADDKTALVSLYTEAANRAGTVDTACFFLTNAYVFALETGHVAAQELFLRLRTHGREE